MEEIVQIARIIRKVWKDVALLTSLFETHEIDEISYSRVGKDETHMEREGTRERLAGALEKLGLTSLFQDVRSGYFIDKGEEE